MRAVTFQAPMEVRVDERPEHLPLDEAPDAYAGYDRREALKIVLLP